MTKNSEVRPMPGRPAILSHQVVNMMAREGRAPLAVVAGLNALRHNPQFVAMVAAKKAKAA